MKRFSRWMLGCGVLAMALTANAQSWGQDPYYRNDPYARNSRESYGAYGYDRNQDYLIQRVMSDLNRAASGAYLDGHERKHFDEVEGNLQEFQSRWARGKFDNGKLDKAIHNLEHLAQADRVRGGDREMLERDLQDLRQFRASRGGYYRTPYNRDRR